MPRRSAFILSALALLSVLATGGGWLVWRNLKARSGAAIAARGGQNLSLRLPDSGQTYMQTDTRWKDDKLGATSQSLGGFGCTVCSVAMAATALGHTVTPGELN